MLKKIASLTLIAALAGTLGACAPEERGGGAGTVGERETPAERAAEMPTEQWGTTLVGDQRGLAQMYSRAAWAQANLAAGQWEQAGEDLEAIEGEIRDMQEDENVPAQVRDQVVALQPMIDQTAQHILNKDEQALSSAGDLVEHFSTVMSHNAVTAWMREGGEMGGGAGTGLDMENRNEGLMEDHNERVVE
ncbi:MAG: hypothetical protein ACLGIN_00150 [Candidatus Sericytochromatia bacterium]